MDSVKAIIQRHKWLLWSVLIFDFVIIFLPQWIDAVWDLAEKIEGRPISMSHPQFLWVYWITIPLALVLLGFTIWATKTGRTVQRPRFIMGGDVRINQNIDKKSDKVVFDIMSSFTNTGDKAAHQIQVRRCYALAEAPSDIFVDSLIEGAGSIDVGEKIFVRFISSYPNQPIRDRNKSGGRSVTLLIFCGLRYSDAPKQGNWYEDERWLAYSLNDTALAYAKAEQKTAFEPFVRKAYANEDAITNSILLSR